MNTLPHNKQIASSIGSPSPSPTSPPADPQVTPTCGVPPPQLEGSPPFNFFKFLASPYSHINAGVREERFKEALWAVRILTKKYGAVVFSPIVYGHTVRVKGLNLSRAGWLDFGQHMLQHFGELWVLMLDGWASSSGVRGEMERAAELEIPIKYIKNLVGYPILSREEVLKEKPWLNPPK